MAKAGSGIPVKFSLHGNQGLAVFSAGYPLSQSIACGTSAPSDIVEETSTSGASVLSYDPVSDQYTYVWKTNKDWSKSCRRLVVRFNDGSQYAADFEFAK
jgi:hypothetical protein